MIDVHTDFKNPFEEKLAEFEVEFIEGVANSNISEVPVTITTEGSSEQEESNMLDVVTRVATESYSRGYQDAMMFASILNANSTKILIAYVIEWLSGNGILYDDEELGDIIHKTALETKRRYGEDNK